MISSTRKLVHINALTYLHVHTKFWLVRMPCINILVVMPLTEDLLSEHAMFPSSQSLMPRHQIAHPSYLSVSHDGTRARIHSISTRLVLVGSKRSSVSLEKMLTLLESEIRSATRWTSNISGRYSKTSYCSSYLHRTCTMGLE